jgi:hypothetical protein
MEEWILLFSIPWKIADTLASLHEHLVNSVNNRLRPGDNPNYASSSGSSATRDKLRALVALADPNTLLGASEPSNRDSSSSSSRAGVMFDLYTFTRFLRLVLDTSSCASSSMSSAVSSPMVATLPIRGTPVAITPSEVAPGFRCISALRS